MALYTDTVMDHFLHPRNVGEIADADGVGEVGNAKCGDIMKMYLKIKDGKIKDVKFETFGCGRAIASRSMATELLIHAYLDGIFDRWMRAGEAHGHQDRRLYKTAKRLKNATAVIDMGERSVDANRWVFDLLAPGYGILCFLLGSRA